MTYKKLDPIAEFLNSSITEFTSVMLMCTETLIPLLPDGREKEAWKLAARKIKSYLQDLTTADEARRVLNHAKQISRGITTEDKHQARVKGTLINTFPTLYDVYGTTLRETVRGVILQTITLLKEAGRMDQAVRIEIRVRWRYDETSSD